MLRDDGNSEEIELTAVPIINDNHNDHAEASESDEEMLLLPASQPHKSVKKGLLTGPEQGWFRRNLSSVALVVMIVGALGASVTAIVISWETSSDLTESDTVAITDHTLIQLQSSDDTKIAFGSCTAYDATYQVLWEQAVIPSSPDAWIWLGDMAYLDTQVFDCHHQPTAPGCNCTADWLHSPPNSCAAGNVRHAMKKWQLMLSQVGYQKFLDFMCPSFMLSTLSPPEGANPSVCPRPILGIYDDHDFGWNNGNKRLPEKATFKDMFLDAIGEPHSSPRRNVHSGAHWSYTLQATHKDRRVDVVLLDGRYHRTTLPCEVREVWCKQVLANPDAKESELAWCKDFLQDVQPSGKVGSCCAADQAVFNGWCKEARNANDPHYGELCDPSHEAYGMAPYVIKNGSAVPPDPGSPGDWDEDAPFCDVLGPVQRRWLRQRLDAAHAPVKLIVSGSVLLGRPNDDNSDAEPRQQCSGDDWDCYRPAQRNLLSTLDTYARRKGGCWVVLVGDYHMSDIKVARGGESSYAEVYGVGDVATPIYQVMASGMTNSTASPGRTCEGWRKDDAGLRPLGNCSFADLPAFGMVHIEWGKKIMRLQIRYAHNGEVAQEYNVSLETCLPAEP